MRDPSAGDAFLEAETARRRNITENLPELTSTSCTVNRLTPQAAAHAPRALPGEADRAYGIIGSRRWSSGTVRAVVPQSAGGICSGPTHAVYVVAVDAARNESAPDGPMD